MNSLILPSLHNRTSRNSDTVPQPLVTVVLNTARQLGIDLQPFLDDARLPPNWIKQPEPITRAQFGRLYRVCMKALGATVCAQRGRGAPTVSDYKLFCYCTINCENLGDVITRAITFTRALDGRAGTLSLTRGEQQAVVSIDAHTDDNNSSALAYDLVRLYFFFNFFSWLTAEPLTLTEVTLAHKPLGGANAATELMRCPVYFNAEKNSLSFDKELLQRPVVRTYKDLQERLAVSALELAPLPAPTRLSVRLENLFRKTLAEQKTLPKADWIAHQLGQSGPTLRRHLAQESTSFQVIIDKCRIDRALELLRQPQLTIDDISASLGFSAASGFSRAFKDWTGTPPSEYRKTLAMVAAQNEAPRSARRA